MLLGSVVMKKICWVITPGHAGCVSQALGLAESLGFQNIVIKKFQKKFPFSLLPCGLWINSVKFTAPGSDTMVGPWPDFIISCGRQAVDFVLYIKKHSAKKPFCVHIQDPKVALSHFDVVVAMPHDNISGENVLITDLAISRINKEKLASEFEIHKHLFKGIKGPIHSILIGGPTNRHKFTEAVCDDLVDKIKEIIVDNKGAFFITPSRRTPLSVIQKLKGIKNRKIHIIDPFSGKNPYFAMLAASEKIFVTNDSVSMVSEALDSGKKVYLIPLKGMSSGNSFNFCNKMLFASAVMLFDQSTNQSHKTVSVRNTRNITHRIKQILKS